MRLRFWGAPKLERRQESQDSYTDALVEIIQSRAAGRGTASASATAAVEAVSGLVGRAFAAAEVETAESLSAALAPPIMAAAGRALIRHGEFVALIQVGRAGLKLSPAQSFDLSGGPNPDTWIYQLSLSGPGRTATYNHVPAAAVVHLRYAYDAARPWRGIGPLQAAALAGRLSAETTSALADESSGPRGGLLAIPTDGEDDTVKNLRQDIRNMRGQYALVEAGDWGAPGGGRAQWQPARLGASPPAALVELAKTATAEIYAACGVNPAIFTDASGTAGREAYRQVLFGLIAPLGRIVSAELTAKLETPVALRWDELRAADISGRARAFQSLVGGGMDLDRAAALSGLLAQD